MTLDQAIDEAVKIDRLRDEMAKRSFLTVEDLAKRYGLSTKTIYRLPIPRTKIPGSSHVRFHPLDVLAWEQRDRIAQRVTPEMVEALKWCDDPRVRPVYEVLSEIVA